MRRIGLPIVLTLIACGTYFLEVGRGLAAEPATFRAGALLALSGPSGYFGEWVKNAVEMAVADINAAGGVKGKKIEVAYRDSKDDAKVGISELRKFADVDRIPVVMASGSRIVIPACPVAEEVKLLLVPVILSPAVRKCGPWTFNFIPDAGAETGPLADMILKRLKATGVGVLAVNIEVNVAVRNAFVQALRAQGGKVVAVETVDETTTDFRPALVKLKALNPPVLFVAAEFHQAAEVLKQARELGIKAQWTAPSNAMGKQIIEVAKEGAEGVIFVSTLYDKKGGEAKVREFAQRYESKYGENPALVYPAHYYDALQLIAKAIEQEGYSAEGIRKYFWALKEYEGVSGSFRFQDRIPIKPAAFTTVKGGKFVPWTP